MKNQTFCDGDVELVGYEKGDGEIIDEAPGGEWETSDLEVVPDWVTGKRPVRKKKNYGASTRKSSRRK